MQIKGFAIVGLVVAAIGCSKDASKAGGDPVDPNAVEVTILYGSEKKTWLEEQIRSFNAGKRQLAGRSIHVTGKAIGSGEAMAAIVAGAEKPTVFSPASGAYVTLLDQAWQARDGHPRPIAPAGEPLPIPPRAPATSPPRPPRTSGSPR